jgi:hypothetical protein
MIEIQQSPSLISFAGNPIFYEVTSNNYLLTKGSQAHFELVFRDIDTAIGRTFQLDFGGMQLVFKSAAVNQYDGFLFKAPTPGETFHDFATSVYQTFLENYYIQQLFSVTLGPICTSERRIILLAKEPGSACSVTLSDVNVTGIEMGTNTPGTDDVYRDYFKTLCLIRDYSNTPIGEDLKSPSLEGSASFDICDYFKANFDLMTGPRFEFPELAGNNLNHGLDFMIQYRVSFAETIEGTVRGLNSDPWKYCLAGGLSHELQTSLNVQKLDFFSIVENKLKFLSWLPCIKSSHSGVLEKLFFLFQENPTSIHYRLVVIVNFTDATHKVINVSELSAFPSFSVVEFKVGYDHLNLGNASADKTVLSWEVFLLDSNDDFLSERRIYLNDTRVIENEKIFFYRNSFSAYDTFRFLGRSELNLDYERVVGSSVREERFSFFNAPAKQFSPRESSWFKSNSGWITQEEKNCLRELMLSTEAYEQIGGELFQVIIRSAKINPFLKDGEYLYNLEIEYERSYQNSYFSVHSPFTTTSNPILIPQILTWDNFEVSFDDIEITFDQVEI